MTAILRTMGAMVPNMAAEKTIAGDGFDGYRHAMEYLIEKYGNNKTKIKRVSDELRDEVYNLSIKPKLVVIQVGNNEASNVYIKQKCNMCNYIGYGYEHVKLDSDVTNEYMLELIDKLNIKEFNDILKSIDFDNKTITVLKKV